MGYEIKGQSIYGKIHGTIHVKEELDTWINEMSYEIEWIEVYERTGWCQQSQQWILQLLFVYENELNKIWAGK